MECWHLNGLRQQEYKKDKVVTGSASTLMWSIEIIYQLDVTDSVSVARNGVQAAVRALNGLLQSSIEAMRQGGKSCVQEHKGTRGKEEAREHFVTLLV